jgi:hypothetical protein
MTDGTPFNGICLYPIVNHPGWADDRHCHNGLWDYADVNGDRQIYQPLACELRRQVELFERPPQRSNEPSPDLPEDGLFGEASPAVA